VAGDKARSWAAVGAPCSVTSGTDGPAFQNGKGGVPGAYPSAFFVRIRTYFCKSEKEGKKAKYRY